MDSTGGAEEQDPYDEQLFNMPFKFSSPLMITVQVDKAKSQLTSSSVLMHFDPEKEIILSCDASPYAVGAVLSHQTEEGERPIYCICIKNIITS